MRCSSASAIVEAAPSRAGPVCREMPANRSLVSVLRAWRPGHSVHSPVLRFGQWGESAAAHASPGEGQPFQPRVTLPPAYSPFLLPLRPSPPHTYPAAYKHRSSAMVITSTTSITAESIVHLLVPAMSALPSLPLCRAFHSPFTIYRSAQPSITCPSCSLPGDPSRIRSSSRSASEFPRP